MPWLVIKGPNDMKTVFILDEDVITIGKDDPEEGIQNSINLSDETVSRRHARIIREGEDYFIEDLESTNHTFVNGREIKKERLKHGDRIIIGLTALVFESEETESIKPSDLMVKFQELDRSKVLDLNYLILHQISGKLATARNFQEFLESMVDTICTTIKADKYLLLLLDDQGEFRCYVTRGENSFYNKAMVEKVRYEKRAVLWFSDLSPIKMGIKTQKYRSAPSMMCAPILKDDEVIGVIYIEDSQPRKFNRSEVILLTAIGNHIASSIEKIILSERIKKEVTLRSSLERFLPPHLAAEIAKVSLDTGKPVIKAEKVLATVLFSDIKKFTFLCKTLEPAELIELLNEYFKMIREIIFKYEGTLGTCTGNTVTVVFGIPEVYPDNAKKAVLAALEIHEEQKKLNERRDPKKKFDVGIGINTGEVITGYAGSTERMEYVVFGEAATLATRLGLLAEPRSIWIGQQTHEMVKSDYVTQFVGKIRVSKEDTEKEVYCIPL